MIQNKVIIDKMLKYHRLDFWGPMHKKLVSINHSLCGDPKQNVGIVYDFDLDEEGFMYSIFLRVNGLEYMQVSCSNISKVELRPKHQLLQWRIENNA